MADNEYNTFTVGLSQSSTSHHWCRVVRAAILGLEGQKEWRWARRRIAERQDGGREACSWFFLSYACTEELKIDWKLEDDDEKAM